MTVNHDALEQLYRISDHYTPMDKRFLSAIGFEFEILESSFEQLFDLCEKYTEHDSANFEPTETDVLRVGLLAPSFIDHSSRLLKLARTYLGNDPEVQPLLEAFRAQAPNLIPIRNALQHNYERIVGDRHHAEQHPLCGEFVWYALTPEIQVDAYFVWFGPFIDQTSGALMNTGMNFRRIGQRKVIDHLTYSAFDIRFDISDAWLATVALVEAVNRLLHERFLQSMQTHGLEIGGPGDESSFNRYRQSPVGRSGTCFWGLSPRSAKLTDANFVRSP